MDAAFVFLNAVADKQQQLQLSSCGIQLANTVSKNELSAYRRVYILFFSDFVPNLIDLHFTFIIRMSFTTKPASHCYLRGPVGLDDKITPDPAKPNAHVFHLV